MSSEERGRPGKAPIVYVVDDDQAVRISLVALLTASGLRSRPFATADDFLDTLSGLEPGCVLLDVRMPGRSGIELLAALREQDCYWPAIVMTGHGEISIAVKAMKLAASDFLEKPFTDARLQEALSDAFAGMSKSVAKSQLVQRARRLLSKLSAREQQVFDGVVFGKTSKEIGLECGLSPRTVEAYRAHMMMKLHAQNTRELLQLANAVGWEPQSAPAASGVRSPVQSLLRKA